MSFKLNNLEIRVNELEKRVADGFAEMRALIEAAKADLKAEADGFPPLAKIPRFPRMLRELGFDPPNELAELERIASEISPEELDAPQRNAQREGA